MSKIEYGKLWSFSRKNFKIKLVRTVKKVIGNLKLAVKNAVSFLHQKLSNLENYLLKKIDGAGSWALDKISKRDLE